MEERLNTFIEPIVNKRKKHDLRAYIQMRKLCKKLKKISPSFDMLMEIHTFLLLIEKVYMHSSNNKYHHLFSATLPNNYKGGAFIYKEDNFSIKFLLRSSDKTINIETERSMISKKEKNVISFKDGEAVINNKYEEEAFQFIIACIMDGLIELIEYYYKNKKF
jgi:hypothetical protein